MTDAPLPDDELASAVVDGLAGDQELARLGSDPALAARVEQLRAVRHAIAASAGDIPTPSAATREQAIAAALAAAPTYELPPDGPDAPDELAERREQRERRPAWLPAAAAAAVVAVLGLGGFAAFRDRGTSGDTNVTASADAPSPTLAGADDGLRDATFEAAGATTTVAAGGSAGGATSGQSAATTAGAATTVAAAPPPTAPVDGPPAPTVADDLPDLGPIDSTEALRAAVVALPSTADGRGAAAYATDPPARPVARLLWVGQPTLVLVVDGPPARALVVTVTGCQPLAEVPLP